MKIKNSFLISYFNLSKKQNDTLGTWIKMGYMFVCQCVINECNTDRYFHLNSILCM